MSTFGPLRKPKKLLCCCSGELSAEPQTPLGYKHLVITLFDGMRAKVILTKPKDSINGLAMQLTVEYEVVFSSDNVRVTGLVGMANFQTEQTVTA